MAILEVEHLKKTYTTRLGSNRVEALRDVNFTVEQGEFVTPSVVREIREETGLMIENPKLCGIKEFHKEQDGKRFIVFLYVACRFSGELRASAEGDVFWYPLSELKRSKELADGFSEMLPVFTSDAISEVFYTKNWDTVFC